MSVWSEIVNRIVPNYNKRTKIRNQLKRRYQKALSEIDAGEEFEFHDMPNNYPELDDQVFEYHLDARKQLEKIGKQQHGRLYIPSDNREQARKILETGVVKIEESNRRDKFYRISTIMAILIMSILVIGGVGGFLTDFPKVLSSFGILHI